MLLYSIFMAIMPIVAVWCFYAGYKLGKTDKMPEMKIEFPRERKEKREITKEQKEQIRRINLMLRNIDHYDGTGNGQVKV